MKYIVSCLFLLSISIGCEPVDRTEGLVCKMSPAQLKPVLDDIFIYEASRSSKSLDSLSLSYVKADVYKFIYKKHNTNRKEVQETIECLTAKKEFVPILKELEASYKEWRTNPKFQVNESNDSLPK